jgi:endoglucanase
MTILRFGLLAAGLALLPLAAPTAATAGARFLFANEEGGRHCSAVDADGRDWRRFRERFVAVDGRVIDRANREISHSEGQGYGMLLAVAYDDRAAFARIRDWTFANLGVRDDGLLAWRWDPLATPHVGDRNNATDGDLLVAWALLEAWIRWRDGADLAAAERLGRAVLKRAAPTSKVGRVLLPGVDGFDDRAQSDGPVVNLSYWVFPALERLGRVTGDPAWNEISATGLRLIEQSRFGLLRLPPEWLALGGDAPVPAAGFPKVFGYNAIRIPLYLAMMQTPPIRMLEPYARLWNPQYDVGPSVIDLETGSSKEPLADTGYKMVIAVAGTTIRDRRNYRLSEMPPSRDYYPSSLELLSRTILRERYSVCS